MSNEFSVAAREIAQCYEDLRAKDSEIERLKALLSRAADALDNGDLAILDEMRKAAPLALNANRIDTPMFLM
jgi:hypothetical protein